MKRTLWWNTLLGWGTSCPPVLEVFGSTSVFSLPFRTEHFTHISTALRGQRPTAWFVIPHTHKYFSINYLLPPSWTQQSSLPEPTTVTPKYISAGYRELWWHPRKYLKTQPPGFLVVIHNMCAKSTSFTVTRGLGEAIWHCKTSHPVRSSASEAINPAKSSSSVTATRITPKLEQMETWAKKTTTSDHSQQEPIDSTVTPFAPKYVTLTTRKVQINTVYWQTQAARIAFSFKTVYVAQHNPDWHHCSWHWRERGKKQVCFVPSTLVLIQNINKPNWGVYTSSYLRHSGQFYSIGNTE